MPGGTITELIQIRKAFYKFFEFPDQPKSPQFPFRHRLPRKTRYETYVTLNTAPKIRFELLLLLDALLRCSPLDEVATARFRDFEIDVDFKLYVDGNFITAKGVPKGKLITPAKNEILEHCINNQIWEEEQQKFAAEAIIKKYLQ